MERVFPNQYIPTQKEIIDKRVREAAKGYRILRKENALFAPRTPDQLLKLIPQLDETSQELYFRITPFATKVKDKSTLEAVYKEVKQLMRTYSVGLVRGTYMTYAERLAEDRIKDTLYRSTMEAMWGESEDNAQSLIPVEARNKIERSFLPFDFNAKYAVLNDTPPFTNPNPYEPAIDLVALGALNLRLHKNSVRADLPIIMGDDKRVLACWTQGEPLNRYHNWDVSCSDRDNIKSF